MAIAAKNNVLTEFAQDYVKGSGAFIHDIVSPPVKVKGRTFRYKELSASNLARNPLVATTPGGATAMRDLDSANTAGYISREFREKTLIDWGEADEHPEGMDGAQMDASATLTHSVHTEAELAFQTALGTITANAAVGAAWNGGGATTPLADIQAGLNSVRSGSYGNLANMIVFPYGAFQRFTLESDVQAYVKGSVSADQMSVEEVENALSRLNGGPIKIVIANAMYDVAGTATEVFSSTAGSAVTYVLRQDTSARAGIRAITQFGVTQAEGVFSGPDNEDPAPRGMVVESKLVRQPFITAQGAGYRITGC